MVYIWLDGVLFYKTSDINEARDIKKYLIEGGIDRNNIEIVAGDDTKKSRTISQQLLEEGSAVND